MGHLQAGEARLLVHCCQKIGHDGQHMAMSEDVTVFWDQASKTSLLGCLFNLVVVCFVLLVLSYFVLTPLGKWATACQSRGGATVLIPPSCVQPVR